MGGNNMACCNALLKYLEDEKMDKKKEKFDSSKWNLECVKVGIFSYFFFLQHESSQKNFRFSIKMYHHHFAHLMLIMLKIIGVCDWF